MSNNDNTEKTKPCDDYDAILTDEQCEDAAAGRRRKEDDFKR